MILQILKANLVNSVSVSEEQLRYQQSECFYTGSGQRSNAQHDLLRPHTDWPLLTLTLFTSSQAEPCSHGFRINLISSFSTLPLCFERLLSYYSYIIAEAVVAVWRMSQYSLQCLSCIKHDRLKIHSEYLIVLPSLMWERWMFTFQRWLKYSVYALVLHGAPILQKYCDTRKLKTLQFLNV